MAKVQPLLGPNPVQSEYLEAYRSLRTIVLTMQGDLTLRTILVTSARPAEGKTTVAVNLATVLALTEKEIVLVDTDFQLPQIHLLYGLDQGPGFTDVCAGEASLEEALSPADVPHLSVLPVGRQAEEGDDMMGSARMHQLLAELKQRFDLVVFDSAPVNYFAGAAQLAAVTDVVLLVVRSRTYAAPVQHALRTLETVGANVPGIVLNDVTAVDREVVGGYHYGYGYGYGYGRKEKPG